jgi:hypothetical protein
MSLESTCQLLWEQIHHVSFSTCSFVYTKLDFTKKILFDMFPSGHQVTGSEDANVYFYDLARPKNSCVNKLQVCVMLALFSEY